MLTRIAAGQDVGQDVDDDDQQARSHGDQAAQAFPAADQQTQSDKGSQQPPQRRGADPVHKEGLGQLPGRLGDGHQDLLARAQAGPSRPHLAPPVVDLERHPLDGTFQHLDAGDLIGLGQTFAQLDLARFNDVHHPGAVRIAARSWVGGIHVGRRRFLAPRHPHHQQPNEQQANQNRRKDRSITIGRHSGAL
jgi:hypothetical protein